MKALKNKICNKNRTIMSNNKQSPADYFKIKTLEEQVKKLREKNEELCYENDDINMRWGQDNERNGDICSEQQEQIKRLEEENKLLKDCDIMQYSYLVQGENKLLKEWQDMKNEIGWMGEHIEVLEKQLDSKYD